MTQQEDERVITARYQKEIRDFLGMDAENLIYEYDNSNGKARLNLVTVNPRHNQSFLFHTTEGIDRLDALRRMLTYIKETRSEENAYTIQWMMKGDRELHTSYFRAKNMYEALDKLYYGRDMHGINVYSVVLNPIS